MTKCRNHKKSVALFVGAFAVALVAHADKVWSGGNNADISDSANWTGLDGAYTIANDAFGLYLSKDWQCPTNMTLSTDGTTISFDLGAERKLSFNGLQYFFSGKNSIVEFLSGTIEHTATAVNNFNLLSSSNWGTKNGGNTFRLKGKNTRLKANKGAIFSYNGDNSTFEICDGASFEGDFNFGNANPKNQTLFVYNGGVFTNSTANYITPSTDGSGLRTIVSNATFSVPNGAISIAGGGQLFSVQDGATLVAKYAITLGGTAGVHSNKFEISGGSKATAQELGVGAAGTALHEALITDAGTVVDSGYGLYVGGRNGSGYSNIVTVADGALLEISQSTSGRENLVVGASGSWNKLFVQSGAVVTNDATGTPRLGQSSCHNTISINGGMIYSARCLVIGDALGANSNKLFIGNGIFRGNTYYCSFKVGGEGGSFNEVEVSDSGLLELGAKNGWSGRNPGNGNDNSYIGFKSAASYNVIRILQGGVFRCPSTTSYGDDTYHAGSKLNIGFAANTCSNRLEVLGGATKIGIIYVGGTNETSVGNALVVSNGTVNSASVYVSQDTMLPEKTAFIAPNTLLVKGTESIVKTTANLIFYKQGELMLDFADGISETIPLQANSGTLEFKKGSLFTVSNIKALALKQRAYVTVARRSVGAITFADGLLDEWNAALAENPDTAGCSLSIANSGKDLVLTIKPKIGFILTVK